MTCDTTLRPGDRLAAQLPTNPYELGPAAEPVLGNLGVDLPGLLQAPRSARPLLRICADWTAQRHHLAARLGAALLTALSDSGCLTRRGRRVIWLTERGATTLRDHLGLELAGVSTGFATASTMATGPSTCSTSIIAATPTADEPQGDRHARGRR
jgi:hypothetical protein